MAAQLLPLSNLPNQSFTIALQVDGNPLALALAVRYNEMAGYWVMTVKDRSGNLLVDSVPFVSGQYPGGNILAPYSYLKIGSAFVINTSGVQQDFPDKTNLGVDFNVVWDDTAA